MKLKQGLGSSLVSVVDLSDLCFTKECKERQAQTELQKQQILANALQPVANSLVDDAQKTIKIFQYVGIGIGALVVGGIIIYATKPTAQQPKRKK